MFWENKTSERKSERGSERMEALGSSIRVSLAPLNTNTHALQYIVD